MNTSRLNTLRGAALVAAATLVMGGCASSPHTYSAADQSVDFKTYQTYAFMSDLQTDQAAYQSLESTYLKEAVANEMEQRGFRPSATPDITINFSIETEEKIRSRSVPTSGFYADPFFGYGYGMAYETRIDQFTEGKLAVHAVETASNRIVWQGTTQGRITKKAQQEMHATLTGAVSEIFSQFPVPAPEAVNVSYSQQ